MIGVDGTQTAGASADQIDSGRRNSNTSLIVILCVLILAIIGLTISIIIVNPFARNSGPESELEPEVLGPPQLTVDDIDDGLEAAMGSASDPSVEDVQKGVEYLEGLKASGEIDGQPITDNIEFDIDLTMVNLLLQNQLGSEALEKLEKIQKDTLDNESLMIIYHKYVEAYQLLGDLALADEYFNKYLEIYNHISREVE